jgi:hypothetical protein
MMRTLTINAISLFLVFGFFSTSLRAEGDTVSMNPGYITDIWYSMETGVEMTSPREIWDIAFAVPVFSASILINDGSGVELYTWGNGDTAGWANVDTNGMSTWRVLFNDPDDWENGAFNRNASDHPDYGWGVYNAISHDVVGDSLYILKRPDGSLYKLWIQRKTYNGPNSVYHFKLANLDGSGEITQTIDCSPYASKNFIYYSIPANQVIDREPASADWDIMFTKYMAMHPTGSPYIVTGVLSNYNLGVAEVGGVSQYLYNTYQGHTYDSSRSVIGYDWKYFDLNIFSYLVDDSTVFFLHTADGDIWKLFFEVFEGTSTGNIEFQKTKLATSGIEEVVAGTLAMHTYPNPASSYINVLTSLEAGTEGVLQLLDLNGRVLRNQSIQGQFETEETSISLEGLAPGMYLLHLQAPGLSGTSKILVK